jgi:pilus assembly protein CpaC
LLDNISQRDANAVPIMQKLPIIGPLFRSRSKRAEQTELMVLVTPRLVRPLDPDEVPPLPTSTDSFIQNPATGEGDIGTQLDGPAGTVDAPTGDNRQR